MELFMLILCVIPTLVTSITISSNGNSPEIKMFGGMMVDVHKGFTPMASTHHETVVSSNYKKSRKINNNSTNLSINERYRRLIPYMTFYYANDLAAPTTEAYTVKDIEVQKAEIVEGSTIGNLNERQPKKIVFPPQRNIPRYQGNRLTQHNIASANPTKLLYKEIPVYHNSAKVTTNYNPLLSEHTITHNYDYERLPQKQIIKAPSVPFSGHIRKPYSNLYSNEDTANIRYYLSEKDQTPKFKLVPYQQSPPVQVAPLSDNFYNLHRKPAPVIPKDQVYVKSRPIRPLFYDTVNIQQLTPRKQPAIISQNYYEKRPRPVIVNHQPIIESGFKPVSPSPQVITTEAPTPLPYFESEKQQPSLQSFETSTLAPVVNKFRPNYYQYVVEQQTYKPEIGEATYKPIVEQPTYKAVEYSPANTVTLGDLLSSLQLNKSIPNPITRENVGTSIRTLLQVLNALKAVPQQNDVEHSILSTPTPLIAPEVIVEPTEKSIIEDTSTSALPVEEEELHEEPYLAPVKTPSQHIDDYPSAGGTSQQFPLPISSDDEGGTPGRPGVDYPILTTIPHTSFDCKTQRYKGFFADPETRCQVWHYCDLNGGQASFLCPNGTIFSQAGLTCDWWFNVRCSATTQLYVLNESLYKFILPHSPKFPEDYSGPLVDKYLTLKFKEMEEQFRKNKKKQTEASDKMDSDETEDSNETSDDKDDNASRPEGDSSRLSDVSETSVIVGSPGTSGNVERLSD